MAWDRAPPYTEEKVKERIFKEIDSCESQIKGLEELITKRKEQLFCKHAWDEKRWTDLGGERNLEVFCEICKYKWF